MSSALSNSDRQTMAEARTLARADRRAELIDALALMDSPTLQVHADEMDRIGLDILHAAAFGQLSGVVEYLCDVIERLDGQLRQAVEMLAERLPDRDADYLIAMTRGLAAAEARREAPAEDLPPSNPVPQRSVWKVNEDTETARELAGPYPGPQADRQAAQLNALTTTPPHVHYMSLPLGAAPFDYATEADRRAALGADSRPLGTAPEDVAAAVAADSDMGLDGYRDTARDSRS